MALKAVLLVSHIVIFLLFGIVMIFMVIFYFFLFINFQDYSILYKKNEYLLDAKFYVLIIIIPTDKSHLPSYYNPLLPCLIFFYLI